MAGGTGGTTPDFKEDAAMLNREQALDEARKQKEALAKIGGWRRLLFLLAASLAALAVFGFQMDFLIK